MTDVRVRISRVRARESNAHIVSCRRAALTGIQERGQVLGVDLWQVSRQDSARHTYALEHGPA